ncbi:uncharacterized protein LOC125560984 isoform X2 [Nematostella vectensis]|uniref:uncharacterized protein LOC125560984 isoform X2 n=1 Tax=Nematostella vectensis TaxID=45351 RepID=UPI002076E6EF|nr:uncharacterized protein LOC125560984 isoform X2 [Nematostella vectensis]
MVLLYIEGKVADFTVYLEQPIEKPRFIALRGCAFHNRCNSLSSEGTVSDGENIILRIPAGQYTIETLKRQIDGGMRLGEKSVSIRDSSLEVHRNVVLNEPLACLLGLKTRELEANTRHEIKMIGHEAIFIHCDLVNASDSLQQGAPSQILTSIELDEGKIYLNPHDPIQM